MKKDIIIAGASGSLGYGSLKIFFERDYENYYLISRRGVEVDSDQKKNVKQILSEDLSKESNVQKIFEEIEFSKSNSYFLFSTVGGFYGGTEIKDMPYDEWLKMFNINLNTSFLLAKHFISNVKDTAGGSICFTSAVSAFSPQKSKAAYGASKNALNYLVETLSLECKKYGISVNAVAPFIIDTKENREWVEDTTQLITPENIAVAVAQIFDQYKTITGNIIKLFGTLN